MSSGWNGIGIRSVGATRHALADLISQQTGYLLEAHKIGRTNPINQHFEDCCAWDAWGTVPGTNPHQVHFYSWDRMKECVRNGVLIEGDGCYDFSVSAYSNAEEAAKHRETCEHKWIEHVLRESNFGVQWGSERRCFRCGLHQFADDTRSWGAAPFVTVNKKRK